MAQLNFKMLHVTVADETAWDLLLDYYEKGYQIWWDDYAAGQYHFLLAGPDAR